MKENILFDIDYTLLNTHISKDNCRRSISSFLKISIDEFKIVEEEYVKKEYGFTDFNPEEYVDYISNKYGVSTKELAKIFFDDNNFRNIAYSEVPALLKYLSINHKLGIFSEGLQDFQLLKLHKSGILKYFNQDITFVFTRKLTEDSLEMLPKGSFIVDDNVFVIEALVKTGLFKPIWLNRKTKEMHKECKTIFDLTGLKETLESYSTM